MVAFLIASWFHVSPRTLEKLSPSMEVLSPEYFPSISRIFPYHGQHFHVKLDKTMEIGFGYALLRR